LGVDDAVPGRLTLAQNLLTIFRGAIQHMRAQFNMVVVGWKGSIKPISS